MSTTPSPPLPPIPPIQEAADERQVLTQMKQEALTLSASPQKRALLGHRSPQYFKSLLLTKLRKLSQGDFVFSLHKEYLLHEITDIALYLRFKETQLSLLPALHALTGSGESIATLLLRRLPDLCELVLQELATDELQGLAFISSGVFPIILQAFQAAPNDLVEPLAEAMMKISKLSSHDILRERVYTFLIQGLMKPAFAALSDQQKAGSLALVAECVSLFSTLQVEKLVTGELKMLSQRCVPFKLQKALARLLTRLCACQVSASSFQSLIFPTFWRFLRQEELWALRKAALEGIAKVAKCAIQAERTDWIQQLVEQIASLLEDHSKWVRVEAVRVLAPFLHEITSAKKQLATHDWPRLQKKIICAVSTALRQTSTSLEDVKFQLAYNLPALLLITSRPTCMSPEAALLWPRALQPLHKCLAHDLDPHVKRSLAASLPEFASLLINKADLEDARPKVAYLLSIATKFLATESDEVQVACLTGLPALFKLIPSELLDGTPKELYQLTYERADSRAVTEAKAAILAQFCDIFVPDVVCGVFENSYEALTEHEAALVRKHAAQAFGAFYLRMQRCHDIQLANSPGLSSSFLKKRYASIAAQAAMENFCAPKQFSGRFQDRVVFIWMVASVADAYLRKGLPQDAQHYADYLLSLHQDPVVCVRLALVARLAALKAKYPNCQLLRDELRPSLKAMRNDPSREVREQVALLLEQSDDEEQEEACVALKIANQPIDPTNFRFIEAELEGGEAAGEAEEMDEEEQENLGLLAKTPANFTEVLKRAVGAAEGNSFLTQLMTAFEERDRQALELKQAGEALEQAQAQAQAKAKAKAKVEAPPESSPVITPKRKMAAPKMKPRISALRPASAVKRPGGSSLIIKSGRATSANDSAGAGMLKLRDVNSAAGLPPLQPKRLVPISLKKSSAAGARGAGVKTLTSAKQSLPNLEEPAQAAKNKGITPPGSRRGGRSSLSSERGLRLGGRGYRTMHAAASSRKSVNLVKQRFMEIATLDENEPPSRGGGKRSGGGSTAASFSAYLRGSRGGAGGGGDLLLL